VTPKTLLSKEGEALTQIAITPPLRLVPNLAKQDVDPHLSCSPNWFAVFTTPRHEKRIAWHCEQRQIECFLPLYRTTHRWKNRCNAQLELPLFPNYLFVRIDWRERVRVLNVSGVYRIVGEGRDPHPVPDDYIEMLRDSLSAHRMEPHLGIEIGERVRIIVGPLAGQTGILLRKKSELRVVLEVEMLARSIAVELTHEQIEPVTPRKAECGSVQFPGKSTTSIAL
jgi:transcription antitermination factor NusG